MLLMMLSLLDDEQRELVERIFKENRTLFTNIARKILGSSTEAEDAVSDAMIQIMRNLEKINHLPHHEMRSYCIVVVKNCAYGRFRKNKRTVSLEEVGADVTDLRNEPGASLLRQERIDEVTEKIRLLPEEDMTLIRLRYYHQLSYKTIAGILGISEETARKRAERIRKELRQQFEGNER